MTPWHYDAFVHIRQAELSDAEAYEAGGWRSHGAVRQDEINGVLLTHLRYRRTVR
jgi:hypothetical protein